MNKNIMFFYKSSYGELHVALPILLKLKEDKKNINLFFIYHDHEVYNNLPDFYKEIVEENFELLLLKKKGIAKFYLKYFMDKNILFNCNNGHTTYTMALSCFWLSSRLVFFPHAYSIEGSELSPEFIMLLKSNPLKYTGFHHDPVFITHNARDITYLNQLGFKYENIVIAGFLGYKKEWIDYLINKTDTIDKLAIKKQGFKQVVFIPMRNHHAQYLTEENFNYLCQSISEFVETFPNYLFIIKPHPRQNDMHGLDNLSNNVDNLIITDVSTVSVSSISDIVISFWSSAIVDAISIKVPVVEFHKHEVHHVQLVRRGNSLISIFHDLSLCPFYEKKEDVIDLLSDSDSWKAIGEIQQQNFGKLFPNNYPDFSNLFFQRIQKTNFRTSYFSDIYSLVKSTVKRFI